MTKENATSEGAQAKEDERTTRHEQEPLLNEAAKRLKLEPSDKKRVRFTIALDQNTAVFVKRLAKDNKTTISDVIARITKDFVSGVSK